MVIKPIKDIHPDSSPHNPAIKIRNILGENEVPNLSKLIQSTFPTGVVAKNHKHDDIYEIFIVRQGSGEVRVDDKVFTFEENDCIIVPPHEYHEFRSTGKEDLVMTYFGINTNA